MKLFVTRSRRVLKFFPIFVILIANKAFFVRPEPVSFVDSSDFFTLKESCTAIVKDILSIQEEATLLCQTPSGMHYNVPFASTEWIRVREESGELRSGQTKLDIPSDALIDKETYTIQLQSPPKLINDEDIVLRRHRHLATTSGTKTVLVIRVKATDGVTSISEADLANAIFGISGDKVNLKSQYLACSHGKLEFAPSPKATNGVVTINAGVSTSKGDTIMINAVDKALKQKFGQSPWNIADFLMYCLPSNTFDGVAYAWMNSYASVYNDIWCTRVSAQMHELGHNIGLAHSGMGTDPYGDRSGMMGYSYKSNDAPEMCFNAAKSWQLGWYGEKSITFLPQADQKYEYFGTIGSIVDFVDNDEDVLIRIHQPSATLDYYLFYNAAKGFNKSTMAWRDKVLITSKDRRSEANPSTLVAAMMTGDSFVLKNFNKQDGETLTVRIKSIDYTNSIVDLSIVLSGPSVPSPTESPTEHPTEIPSQQPTLYPTRDTVYPSAYPSLQPSTSLVPSSEPTGPTQSPTSSSNPSADPSSLPSVVPSISRSPDSSWNPTAVPSSFPTETPTKSPTKAPTKAPSGEPSLSFHPTEFPTLTPTTSEPSAFPSFASSNPSSYPSFEPSTSSPTQAPTQKASSSPTQRPSITPSISLSQSPSHFPSPLPTDAPTQAPVTSTPTRAPVTNTPTPAPSTNAPSQSPVTNSPSRSPVTIAPSLAPVTDTPSQVPVSSTPHQIFSIRTSDPSPIPTTIISDNSTPLPSSSNGLNRASNKESGMEGSLSGPSPTPSSDVLSGQSFQEVNSSSDAEGTSSSHFLLPVVCLIANLVFLLLD